MRGLPLWVLLAGMALLGLMGFDKGRAKKGGRRVAEATLFAWALLGGAWGGTLGMLLFHHKTRHWYFKLGFPLLTALQTAAALWLWRRGAG